jgi:colanic acid/amylovoran biosynthesis glycosyltransferase
VVVRIHGDVSGADRQGAVKLLIAAEFCEKKGHEVLFEALKRLGRSDLVLWVAGEGELDVRELAENAGIADQVVFMGRLPYEPLSVLYDACDIFVLPSRTAANGDREGVPVAIMEAMSRRKPVVSTHHVGIPELVRHGLLVDENDAEALAHAIAKLADDPELRRELGELNYQIIKDEFSEAAVLRLREIFGAAAAGQKQRDRRLPQ